MVLRPEGIMGTNELTKDYIKSIFSRRKKITAEDGGVR
jgi:branched-chain amino acid transport system permease protein